MSEIGVLGAGTWGTALARTLCNAGHTITLWSISKEEVESLSTSHRHINLPNTEIPQGIRFTNSIENACKEKQYIICAVPSVYVRSTMAMASSYISDEQVIIDVAKGIEEETLLSMTEVIRDELKKCGPLNAQIVALSGPTHAEEVSQDLPTTIVAACDDIVIAEKVQELFNNTCIRVYTNTDVRGVELCGALKNVIALAAGISSGLGFGDNAKAALITRGLAEIERLGIAMGCQGQAFNGLAGIGDLIVTATSKHSRNNLCGYLLGQGYQTSDAVKQVGMVVEGINVLPAVIKLSLKYEVDMPITRAVFDVVKGNKTSSEAATMLIGREKTTELQKTIMDINFEKAVLRNTAMRGDQGMKRVITYGTFDLLHYGHINLLRRAKALGDYLIVVISTDEFNWKEKHKKCYFTYEQRKALVESIRYVDLVIPEESWNQKRTDMHEYHVDTFVMGDDWKGKFDFLKEEGVEVVYLPRTPEISSSQIKRDLYDANSIDGTSVVNHDDIDTDPR
jgi:glycerol-3-phosphate cytidylyltransferase